MSDEAYKRKTTEAYNRYATEMAAKFAERTQEKAWLNHITHFSQSLTGRKIVDIGCGSGDHALFLQAAGYDVTCIDISEQMVNLCRSKGLNAQMGDIEKLSLPSKYFDGIWAATSILHVPKHKISNIVQRFSSALQPKGIIGLIVKEGSGEKLESDDRYPGIERWFSYFSDDEVRSYFSQYQLLYTDRDVASTKSTFLHYTFQKKA